MNIFQTSKELRDLDAVNGREVYLYGCAFMCYVFTINQQEKLDFNRVLGLYIEAKKNRCVTTDPKRGVTAYVESYGDLLKLLKSPFTWTRREGVNSLANVKINNNQLAVARWRTPTNGTHFTVFANVNGVLKEIYDPFNKSDRDVNYNITKKLVDRIDILTRN